MNFFETLLMLVCDSCGYRLTTTSENMAISVGALKCPDCGRSFDPESDIAAVYKLDRVTAEFKGDQ